MMTPAEEVSAFLTENTNAALYHQMEAMRHMFITRLTYDAFQYGVTEAQINLLAEEAWVAFASSSIYAFATWLFEAETEVETEAETDRIVGAMRKDWFEWVSSIVPDFIIRQ